LIKRLIKAKKLNVPVFLASKKRDIQLFRSIQLSGRAFRIWLRKSRMSLFLAQQPFRSYRFAMRSEPDDEYWSQRDWLEPFDERGRLIPFGVLPTPMQLGHDPRFTGSGITVAMIDSGFFPHPDIVTSSKGENRLRAWVDCSRPQIRHRFFKPDSPPRWPLWDRRYASQWHGMMTTAVAAGTNATYPGLAPGVDLVFVQTWDGRGRITNAALARALRWLFEHRQRLNLRIVNLSVGGDPLKKIKGNFVDAAVQALVDTGVVVVAASGNSGRAALIPPATAPAAIVVGGLDTRNSPVCSPLAPREECLWRLGHSNWGRSWAGMPKPDLIAPSVWLAAPVLPESTVAIEAQELFERRNGGDVEIEARIAELKLLSPHFQHVDGTSFAAAVTSGAIACLLEAAPHLTPEQVRQALCETALPLPDVPKARQGAGALRPREAVARGLASL
jgi:serine protease AprX